MDDLIEFLKVYPLNSDSSDLSKGPRPQPQPQNDYPSSYPYSSENQPDFQYSPQSESAFIKENFFPKDQDFPDYSQPNLKTWNDLSSSGGTMQTRAKSGQASSQASQLNQPINRSNQASDFALVPIVKNSVSSRLMIPKLTELLPSMPVLTDARDDGDFSDLSEHGESVQLAGNGGNGGKIRKGKQRGSGTLSAHAIYARMNRERKKKYMLELEQYRKIMKRKNVESQKELKEMQKETEILTQEIAILRNQLVGNDTLMTLLTAGRR